MDSALDSQKQYLVLSTNKVFKQLDIPIEIDPNTLSSICEEELFLTLWDANMFAFEKKENSQLYKLWMEKVHMLTNDIQVFNIC